MSKSLKSQVFFETIRKVSDQVKRKVIFKIEYSSAAFWTFDQGWDKVWRKVYRQVRVTEQVRDQVCMKVKLTDKDHEQKFEEADLESGF